MLNINPFEIIEKRLDEIKNNIEKKHCIENLSNIKKNINEFNKIYHKLCSLKKKCESIDMNIKDISTTYNNLEYTNIPTLLKQDLSEINNFRNYKNKIPIKIVNSIKEIPNYSLYWINGLNQFAIKINGIVLKGNLSNIYEFKEIKEDNIKRQYYCKYKKQCKKILNNELCDYHHDINDLYELFTE